MPLLSRKSDYALLILSYLYREQSGGSAREIASRFGLSRGFVANILKVLCNKGFVTSQRGVNGGYLVHRPAEEIRLTDLMDSLDDSFQLTQCTHGPQKKEDVCAVLEICPLRGALAEVHHRIRKVLENVTLADLFRPEARGSTEFGLTVTSLMGQSLVAQ